MNIYETLKADHQKVSGLFVRIEQTKDMDKNERLDLFQQLKNDLTVHTTLEEQIFYSELRMYEETKGLIPESIKEHETVKFLLSEISGLATDDSEWLNKIHELRKDVEEHVEEEETVLFKLARRVLSSEQELQMGISMKIEKDKFAPKVVKSYF